MTILERWGLFYINRHVNSKACFLKRISTQSLTRIAIVLSFVIGFAITLLIVLADLTIFSDLAQVFSSGKLLSLLIAINVVLVGLEFWLLFHLSFYVVACYIANINDHQCISKKVKASLVRAVLELNEPKIERFGLNPYRQINKHYWLTLVLYKAKVLISNALAKLVARKILTRVGLRSYAPLIATLITGAWDAWIQGAVLKEVRFRISGRLYVLKLLANIHAGQRTPMYIETVIRLLALRIEYYGSYNVNLDYLIVALDKQMDGSVKDFPDLFDYQLLKDSYAQLSSEEQHDCRNIMAHLMAFKCKKLSNNELALGRIFSLTMDDVKRIKQHYEALA